jgi:hypothetical protein
VRPLQVVFNVNAIDAKSVAARADDFADALSFAIESRRSPR